MTTTKRWIDNVRIIHNAYVDNEFNRHLLDGTYNQIDCIEGLNVDLYPHQKPIIKAMVDLENTRCLNGIFAYNSESCILYTTAGVLSEPNNSGKIVDILGTILINNTVQNHPIISGLRMLSEYKHACGYKYSDSIITKKYKNILKPTIIIVNEFSINQWIHDIETFTKLSWYMVCDIDSLRLLFDMITEETINKYDIIIVSNKKISSQIKLPFDSGSHSNTIRTQYIYNIIANLKTCCWNRVVIDNFDEDANIKNGIINGLFTWYISINRTNTINRKQSNIHDTTDQLFLNNSCTRYDIMNNKILFDIFNIRNNPKFNYLHPDNAGIPNIYYYGFDMPNLKCNYIIRNYINSGLVNFTDKLHSGCEKASRSIRTTSSSVIEILTIILKDDIGVYLNIRDILKFIKKVELLYDSLSPMESNLTIDNVYTKNDISNGYLPHYKYPNLLDLLNTTKIEYEDLNKKYKIKLDRIKNNIKYGECLICCQDFDNENNVILTCCGIILCAVCCYRTMTPNFNFEKNGQCSNCRHEINYEDIIYISNQFDLTKIVDDDIEYKDNTYDPTRTHVSSGFADYNMKWLYVIDIIENKIPQFRKSANANYLKLNNKSNTNISNIITEPNKISKLILFININDSYIQTLNNHIEKTPDTKYIKIDLETPLSHNHINEFNECKTKCVLLIYNINRMLNLKLNLQKATDIIFTFKIDDFVTEKRIINRVYRMGRKDHINIHYVIYNQEIDLLIYNKSIELI